MISGLLKTLERGLLAMRTNTNLLLVGILVFIFPILFVWVTQSFFDTAYSNIQTSEKRRVGVMQDSIESLLRAEVSSSTLAAHLQQLALKNPDITKIRVLKEQEETLFIENALDKNLIGTTDSTTDLHRTALSDPGKSFTFEFLLDGDRTWQVFRLVILDESDYFIFSEHSFKTLDAVMSARRQQSYFGLTAIFLFLIALAYWITRQMYWHKAFLASERSFKDQGQFTNMMVHELRAPLTAIKGYASFIEEGGVSEDNSKRYAHNISGATKHLLNLVSDFLEVARLQSGQLSLEPTNVNVSELLKTVADELAALAKEKHLELKVDKEGDDVFLQTDEKRLKQVLINMTNNALKYTPSGTVTLSVEESRLVTVIKVKDTGTGISAEDQKRLFAPFMRVGEVNKSDIVGSGLGMWITKQLVTLLNASVGIESIQGVGTHVIITFKH